MIPIIIQTLICYNRNNIARKTNKILAIFSLVTVIAEMKQTMIKMELEIATIIIKVQWQPVLYCISFFFCVCLLTYLYIAAATTTLLMLPQSSFHQRAYNVFDLIIINFFPAESRTGMWLNRIIKEHMNTHLANTAMQV